MTTCLPCEDTLDLTSTDHTFLMRAAQLSGKSDMTSKHGCVAVLNGKIIGRGFNSNRTQSIDGFIRNTCSCHAEIAAIRNVWHKICDVSRSSNNPCLLFNQEQSEFIQKNQFVCCAYG